jgi:hypothetical protein
MMASTARQNRLGSLPKAQPNDVGHVMEISAWASNIRQNGQVRSERDCCDCDRPRSHIQQVSSETQELLKKY